MRKASINRTTKETSISVDINLDGQGQYEISTGIGFLDHMLEQLAKHSLIDIKVIAKGDTHIDYHHTTEDTGIAIGECIAKALSDRKGISRYAHFYIPMDVHPLYHIFYLRIFLNNQVLLNPHTFF